MPPRVDYELTDMGRSLSQTIGALVAWAEANRTAIDSARLRYDQRAADPQPPVSDRV